MTRSLVCLTAVLLGATVLFAGCGDATSAGDLERSIPAEKSREMLDNTRGEGALTQADIDAYIRFIDDVAAAKGNKSAIGKAISRSGRTQERLLYIKMKTDMGCMVESGVPKAVFDSAPPHLHPSEPEMALIRKNLQRLQNASFKAEFPAPQ